jgi:glycerol-3-phosphate dehydrogenase
MTRDTERLAKSAADPASRFDVLVVGGGIHGLFAAYDAASRGFRTALVDRADLGGGVSANHQRTLHGGLRALQSGNIAKCRSQINERRTWARIAPHLMRPLPFLFGTYRSPMRSRLAVRAGFQAYAWLARHRNAGVSPELHLPKGRLESAAATRRLFQGIAPNGLTGGAMWYDYQTTQAERLTLCVAMAAEAAGAVLANYVEVTAPLMRGNDVAGVIAKDLISGQTMEIHAAVTILAAAEGLPALHASFQLPEAPPLVHAMNLLLDRRGMDMAHVAPAAGGGMLTAVPWRGFVLVGTSQSRDSVAPGTRATEADVEAFLAGVNSAFPNLKAGVSDIRLVHQGLVPAKAGTKGFALLPDFEVRTHPRAGVISLIGAKYTTARLAAERAVDAARSAVGRAGTACATARRPLPHAQIADIEGHLIETARETGKPLETEVLRHLAQWYGTEAPELLKYARASAFGDARLLDNSPVLAAEVAYARDHAMAVTADDVINRRTALGGVGRVDDATRSKVEAVLSGVTGPTARGR